MWNDSFPFISLITGLILTELQRATELLCLPAWAPNTLPLHLWVCVCVCTWTSVCVCVCAHVTGWHKVNIGVRFSAFACVKTSLFFFSFFACAKCVVFFWECTRAQGRVRRAGRMCCTGWLQWQANAAFNEGGGERRGKHRKLNWYVNDGNSHLSWRLRVLQH